MKRLLLYANPERPGALEALAAAQDWLGGRADADVAAALSDQDAALATYAIDGVIAFGGDGTLLHVARALGERQVPVLGINRGHLGYLAEWPREEMFAGLAAFLEDRAEVAARMMLECLTCCDGEKACSIGFALNDVSVTSATGRMAVLDVAIDGKPVSHLRGDGVIVATPTGSTAYSLSAGGPILSPLLRAMVLTPICPHELAMRPLVLSAQEDLTIAMAERSAPARIAVDGREACSLSAAARVEIRAARRVFQLVQTPHGRYDILRQKLGWGGRDS